VIPYQTVRYGYDEENQCAYIVRQYDPCEDSEHIDDGQEVRDDLIGQGIKICPEAEDADRPSVGEENNPAQRTEKTPDKKIEGHDYIKMSRETSLDGTTVDVYFSIDPYRPQPGMMINAGAKDPSAAQDDYRENASTLKGCYSVITDPSGNQVRNCMKSCDDYLKALGLGPTVDGCSFEELKKALDMLDNIERQIEDTVQMTERDIQYFWDIMDEFADPQYFTACGNHGGPYWRMRKRNLFTKAEALLNHNNTVEVKIGRRAE
ncbi:MAG: hypothetical protein HQM16_19205, partial [Deltaproteobacteria bacterium]|nr:hypothetical protein [Deltaproteobacteria bacterium]